jgi:hypothetical protein
MELQPTICTMNAEASYPQKDRRLAVASNDKLPVIVPHDQE